MFPEGDMLFPGGFISLPVGGMSSPCVPSAEIENVFKENKTGQLGTIISNCHLFHKHVNITLDERILKSTLPN